MVDEEERKRRSISEERGRKEGRKEHKGVKNIQFMSRSRKKEGSVEGKDIL